MNLIHNPEYSQILTDISLPKVGDLQWCLQDAEKVISIGMKKQLFVISVDVLRENGEVFMPNWWKKVDPGVPWQDIVLQSGQEAIAFMNWVNGIAPNSKYVLYMQSEDGIAAQFYVPDPEDAFRKEWNSVQRSSTSIPL